MTETWSERIDRYIREGRTVSGGKGAGTANSQRQQELNMQTQAFNQQQQQLQMLNKAFSSYLSGNQGFNPQALAAMRSQFLNNNSQTFNNAGQQVRQALAARGEGTGQNPVGGVYANNLGNLMAAQAASQSQGLLGLNVQNQQQALNNMFNAGSLLSGNAATLTGTQGVAGAGASSALGSYIQGKNSGFLQSFASGLGSGLGGGLSSGLTGGIGKAFNGIGGLFGGGGTGNIGDYSANGAVG